jgi:hypothetical protein
MKFDAHQCEKPSPETYSGSQGAMLYSNNKEMIKESVSCLILEYI